MPWQASLRHLISAEKQCFLVLDKLKNVKPDVVEIYAFILKTWDATHESLEYIYIYIYIYLYIYFYIFIYIYIYIFIYLYIFIK